MGRDAGMRTRLRDQDSVPVVRYTQSEMAKFQTEYTTPCVPVAGYCATRYTSNIPYYHL